MVPFNDGGINCLKQFVDLWRSNPSFWVPALNRSTCIPLTDWSMDWNGREDLWSRDWGKIHFSITKEAHFTQYSWRSLFYLFSWYFGFAHIAKIFLDSFSHTFEVAVFYKGTWRNFMHSNKWNVCRGFAWAFLSQWIYCCGFSHLYASVWLKHVSFPAGASERHRETQHGCGLCPQPVRGSPAWLWCLCHRCRVRVHPAGYAQPGPAMEKYLRCVHGKKAKVSRAVQTVAKEEGPKKQKIYPECLRFTICFWLQCPKIALVSQSCHHLRLLGKISTYKGHI